MINQNKGMDMNRRSFFKWMLGATAFVAVSNIVGRLEALAAAAKIAKIDHTEEEWKRLLTPEQYDVLREEGTEHPFSSPLNHEKRNGIFVCAACQLPLFPSKFKFDSGTGWPSFFDGLKENIATKTDYKIIAPRTEYHCARCGGHQGHVFDDGPKPTGLRYCNNGVALTFIPDAEKAS